jgi:pimeloyl-ACP methyl ester carboxylesterase
MAQFADPELRECFRLVALDLRGHGESQGAFGAVDQEGNPLGALAVTQHNDGNVETTSRSWAYDLDATIEALHLDHPILIGWSAGAWVIQSYFLAHSRLGTIGKTILCASVPVPRRRCHCPRLSKPGRPAFAALHRRRDALPTATRACAVNHHGSPLPNDQSSRSTKTKLMKTSSRRTLSRRFSSSAICRKKATFCSLVFPTVLVTWMMMRSGDRSMPRKLGS